MKVSVILCQAAAGQARSVSHATAVLWDVNTNIFLAIKVILIAKEGSYE